MPGGVAPAPPRTPAPPYDPTPPHTPTPPSTLAVPQDSAAPNDPPPPHAPAPPQGAAAPVTDLQRAALPTTGLLAFFEGDAWEFLWKYVLERLTRINQRNFMATSPAIANLITKHIGHIIPQHCAPNQKRPQMQMSREITHYDLSLIHI